jgi:hypothetical protein
MKPYISGTVEIEISIQNVLDVCQCVVSSSFFMALCNPRRDSSGAIIQNLRDMTEFAICNRSSWLPWGFAWKKGIGRTVFEFIDERNHQASRS